MHKTSTHSPAFVLKRTAAQALAITLVVVSLGATSGAIKPAVVTVVPVEPRVVSHAFSPVNGRELLHDQVAVQPESAERARTENDTPSASPAAGHITKTLASLAPAAPAIAAPRFRTIEMEVTAYCPCKKCCGPNAQGITASGKPVSYNGGLFVAADRMHKFGTRMIIPGYAAEVPVEVIDRGGAIKGNKLDVYFPTHQEALKWGRQKKVRVTVFE